VDQPSVKKWIGYGLFPEWCPNAKVPKIAFQLARNRGSKWFSIWTVDIVEGEAKFPTEIISSLDNACVCPSWSADGTKLSYCTVGAEQYDESVTAGMPGSTGENIWVIDIDGRNNLRLTHDAHATNYAPNWSSDGRVFFCSDRAGIDNVWSIRPEGVTLGQPTTPLRLSGNVRSGVQAN